MTVLEAIQKGTDFLSKKGVESPRLNAELLLAHQCKLPRLKLYLQFERALCDAESDAFRDLLVRRGKREPLQHIVGSTSFCGLDIAVSNVALVPRPETELLAELAWKFLATRENPSFLEIGAGTGCVSLAIAQNAPNAKGVAVEISPEAFALAQKNLAGKIDLRLGNLFEPIRPEEKFDAIVSNPPYIPTAEIATLSPEVRDHDPRPALDGGPDGLDFYRIFATEAPIFLKPTGKLIVEFGDGQASAIACLLRDAGWTNIEIVKDLTKKERALAATL